MYKEGLMPFKRKAALVVVFTVIIGHTLFSVPTLSAEEIGRQSLGSAGCFSTAC
jgi:hypothetical protein